jgi:aldehyde dehydrogenase (NAD+)
MMSFNISTILDRLKINVLNDAFSIGSAWGSSNDTAVKKITSPVDGQAIASVKMATATDYDQAVTAAQQAFKTWRTTPAPKRGEIVRQVGDALRKYKADLGALVSYEMGKSLQEGLGEVQEMIDICDFAVGQSRQLYGLTMHSERPQHRMYEQYHPLGVVGIISAFNFPVAVLELECGAGLGMRQCVHLETIRKNTFNGHCLPAYCAGGF